MHRPANESVLILRPCRSAPSVSQWVKQLRPIIYCRGRRRKPMFHTQPVMTAVSDNGKVGVRIPDPEVVSKPKRRRFSNGYKLRILDEADQCADVWVGALLRREGLYSSHLTTWRQQRERGELQRLSTKKRGRQPDPQAAEVV